MSNYKHGKKSVKLFLIATAAVCAMLWLDGCKVPGMHQPEIEQGNIVTQKMVDKLRPQMTKAQVEFVLGRPVYQNSFNVNRWDYVFTKESRKGELERKVLTLKFEEDLLAGISGDYRPEGDTADELEQSIEPTENSDSEDEVAEEEEEEENTSNDSDEDVKVKVLIPNR